MSLARHAKAVLKMQDQQKRPQRCYRDRPHRIAGVSSIVDAQALRLRLSQTGSNQAGGWSVRLAAIWK